MTINIKNLEQLVGSLQTRIDELEAGVAGVMDIGSVDNSGYDATSWSGEVFFNGRRYYSQSLWGTAKTFGTDVEGTSIPGTPSGYVKISLDPATNAADIVYFKTAAEFASARKSSDYTKLHTGALWHSLSAISGPLEVSYPAATWDNGGKIKYSPFQGYVKEDGSVTVTGGKWWANTNIGTVGDSSNSTHSKYAILTITVAEDGSATTGAISWVASLTASTVADYVIPIGEYDSKKNWTQYFMGYPNITVHKLVKATAGGSDDYSYIASPNVGMSGTSGIPVIGANFKYAIGTVDGVTNVMKLESGTSTMWVWGADV